MRVSWATSTGVPYQSEEDAEELNDVGVSDRVETSEQRVRDGDERRHDDRGVVVHLDDHRQRRTCTRQNRQRPRWVDI